MNLLIGVFVEAAKTTSQAQIFSVSSNVDHRLCSRAATNECNGKERGLQSSILELHDRVMRLELSHERAVSTTKASLATMEASLAVMQVSHQGIMDMLERVMSTVSLIRDESKSREEPATN